MPRFFSQFLRFVLKLVLLVLGLVFAVSLIVAALLVVVLNLVKALLTGRKPAPAMVFGRFQRFSPKGMWPGSANREGAKKTSAAGEVVDVEVREISDVKTGRQLP